MLGSKVLPKLVKAFDKKYKSVSREMTTSTRDRAVSSIAAKAVVTKVLQVRKLLKAFRSISKIELRDRSDFGDCLHCAHSEPYFYESAYLFEKRPQTLIADEQGRCRPTCNEANEDTTGSVPKCWKCCSKCKPVTNSEVSTILKFKCITCMEAFPGLKVNSRSECVRCSRDKHTPKLYSMANNMNPGPVPSELQVREQKFMTDSITNLK